MRKWIIVSVAIIAVGTVIGVVIATSGGDGNNASTNSGGNDIVQNNPNPVNQPGVVIPPTNTPSIPNNTTPTATPTPTPTQTPTPTPNPTPVQTPTNGDKELAKAKFNFDGPGTVRFYGPSFLTVKFDNLGDWPDSISGTITNNSSDDILVKSVQFSNGMPDGGQAWPWNSGYDNGVVIPAGANQKFSFPTTNAADMTNVRVWATNVTVMSNAKPIATATPTPTPEPTPYVPPSGGWVKPIVSYEYKLPVSIQYNETKSAVGKVQVWLDSYDGEYIKNISSQPIGLILSERCHDSNNNTIYSNDTPISLGSGQTWDRGLLLSETTRQITMWVEVQ